MLKNFKLGGIDVAQEIKTFLIITLGAVIYCAGTVFFVKPAMLPNPGVMGLCLFLNYLLGTPIAVTNLLINCVLFMFAYKFLPRRFFWWTLYGVFAMSFFMNALEGLPKPVIQDRMLLVVVSAVLHGVANAMVFSTGGSTGGVDIISVALRRRYGIELGNASRAINFGVIALFLYIVPVENVIYGLLLAYISSLVLNGDLRAFSQRQEVLVITNQTEKVKEFILHELHRGVTLFNARGGYGSGEHDVIMSLLSPRQSSQLKKFLKDHDPKAFMRIAIASEVLGRGFRKWEQE